MNYYYTDGTREIGPLSGDAMRELHTSGIIRGDTWVRSHDSKDWKCFEIVFYDLAQAHPGKEAPTISSPIFENQYPNRLEANGRRKNSRKRRETIVSAVMGLAIIAGGVGAFLHFSDAKFSSRSDALSLPRLRDQALDDGSKTPNTPSKVPDFIITKLVGEIRPKIKTCSLTDQAIDQFQDEWESKSPSVNVDELADKYFAIVLELRGKGMLFTERKDVPFLAGVDDVPAKFRHLTSEDHYVPVGIKANWNELQCKSAGDWFVVSTIGASQETNLSLMWLVPKTISHCKIVFPYQGNAELKFR
jgi:hypothetical protein